MMMTASMCNKLYLLANQQIAQEQNFELMDVLHHFTSGYKAVCTYECYTGIDQLRQACGGAGFLLSSRIADIWGDIAPLVTLEGVNVVMLQ
jgi:alkylation response protein AidB-like acyl-CoA dehydrogenase